MMQHAHYVGQIHVTITLKRNGFVMNVVTSLNIRKMD